ncbi:nucleoside kinase [Clostridium frigidicarnis]|uniref:Uridine kinase n=1 Tax=Clostridium frigidicarnis TaxID=84698 RepID=A0A1I1ADG9_9CLOT|nr:uridine kinase [Clostridium frigidicarnis]
MSQLTLKVNDNRTITVTEGTKFYDVVKENFSHIDIPVVLAKLDNDYFELREVITKGGELSPVTIEETIGMKTYSRTLQFILIKAVYDLFPEAKVVIEHSLSKGIYGEIHKDKTLDEEDIKLIKDKMKDLIDENIIINKLSVPKEEALKIFENYRFDDKVRFLNHIKNKEIKLYELQGRYDYFYGPIAYSTGSIKMFDLIYHEPGFLLRFPDDKNPKVFPKSTNYPKLENIFRETEEWLNILGVADVGALNNAIDDKSILELIMVNEALHEKKIAYIADMIHEREDVKLVLIAGPSSSGKTTFARRLGIQLRVNGRIPIPISLDDYFVDRDKTPLDENGEYDFESIDALDLELFNKHLNMLMNGKEIELPSFNFKLGCREWVGNKIKLPENGVLVVEGIHGLNDKLTSKIPGDNKFKIYISALTQLNVDNHNRIATTDVRKLRRTVRDFLSRGYQGGETLNMWPSIKRGEEKNIFVYQEEADVMFNSTLVYELCVLKKYALEELSKIDRDSSVYYEALRLMSFLRLFKEVDRDIIPTNSILREFVGGSIFYKY